MWSHLPTIPIRPQHIKGLFYTIELLLPVDWLSLIRPACLSNKEDTISQLHLACPGWGKVQNELINPDLANLARSG